MKDDLPHRLGNLASTLGRISQRALQSDSAGAVPLALHESRLMMEWNVRAAPDEILIQLAAMQAELGLWRKGWEAVEQSEALRMLLARRTREMSDRVLELSGLLKQPAA